MTDLTNSQSIRMVSKFDDVPCGSYIVGCIIISFAVFSIYWASKYRPAVEKEARVMWIALVASALITVAYYVWNEGVLSVPVETIMSTISIVFTDGLSISFVVCCVLVSFLYIGRQNIDQP